MTARPKPRGSIGRALAENVLPHHGVQTAWLPPSAAPRGSRAAARAASSARPPRAASVGAKRPSPLGAALLRTLPAAPAEPPQSTPPARAAGPTAAHGELTTSERDDYLGAALRAALAEQSEQEDDLGTAPMIRRNVRRDGPRMKLRSSWPQGTGQSAAVAPEMPLDPAAPLATDMGYISSSDGGDGEVKEEPDTADPAGDLDIKTEDFGQETATAAGPSSREWTP